MRDRAIALELLEEARASVEGIEPNANAWTFRKEMYTAGIIFERSAAAGARQKRHGYAFAHFSCPLLGQIEHLVALIFE